MTLTEFVIAVFITREGRTLPARSGTVQFGVREYRYRGDRQSDSSSCAKYCDEVHGNLPLEHAATGELERFVRGPVAARFLAHLFAPTLGANLGRTRRQQRHHSR
jgi:hypothetical protein